MHARHIAGKPWSKPPASIESPFPETAKLTPVEQQGLMLRAAREALMPEGYAITTLEQLKALPAGSLTFVLAEGRWVPSSYEPGVGVEPGNYGWYCSPKAEAQALVPSTNIKAYQQALAKGCRSQKCLLVQLPGCPITENWVDEAAPDLHDGVAERHLGRIAERGGGRVAVDVVGPEHVRDEDRVELAERR